MYRRLAVMKNYTTASSVGTRKQMIPGNASKAMVSKASSSSSGLKKWPAPMVESNGDYREEAFLETHIGGPLYANQRNLPRLPVPDVKDTLQRFLPTALPLAESEEEKKTLEQACQDFPREAEQLQRRLEARSDATTGEYKDSSWLQLWWNTAGYLQVRDTVVINVSYYFHFSDDGTLPDTVANEPVSTTDMRLGVQRAASLVSSAAEFRHKVCSGTLPCEAIGRKEPKTPLCSTAYKYMFHACRIPQHEQDSYRIYDPSNHRHCIVACRGHFFALDFLQENGIDPLPLSALEARFSKCVELANAKSSLQGDSPLLGWMTSMDRDSWADARAELLRTGGAKMEEALSVLESGAFVVCLDNEAPTSRNQCAMQFLTGGLGSGYNRWFDKSIQLICTANGKAGLLGEHSMMDGMPMVGFADHIAKSTYKDAETKFALNPAEDDFTGGVSDIFDNCTSDLQSSDSQVASLIDNAKLHFSKLVTDHEITVQSFQAYGSNYIKKAGYSPDAYVQVAMQLATYRLWGKQAGTYEATQVRPFLHGRTETTRSVSLEGEAFVKQMGVRPKHDENDESIRSKKLELLHNAVTSHVKYIGNAAKAMGVDRHFFGLSMMVADGENVPSLYSHPLFVRSKRWRVSTSHLTHPKFDNWGYGEVYPDGVGLSYAIKADSCVFSITALKENGWTDRLSHLLEEALMEMRTLNDLNKPLVSKL